MFNLHKNADLLPLAGLRKDRIFKEMEEGKDTSPIIETNLESSEHGESPGGQPEQQQLSSGSEGDSESDRDFVDHENLPDQLRKPKAQRQMRRRLMNDFLSSLHIPVYAGVKFYYYHDVLEALARCLFQNLLLQAHVEAEEEEDKEESEGCNHEPEALAKSVALGREGVAEECL
jgi:hypothetical protein